MNFLVAQSTSIWFFTSFKLDYNFFLLGFAWDELKTFIFLGGNFLIDSDGLSAHSVSFKYLPLLKLLLWCMVLNICTGWSIGPLQGKPYWKLFLFGHWLGTMLSTFNDDAVAFKFKRPTWWAEKSSKSIIKDNWIISKRKKKIEQKNSELLFLLVALTSHR